MIIEDLHNYMAKALGHKCRVALNCVFFMLVIIHLYSICAVLFYSSI